MYDVVIADPKDRQFIGLPKKARNGKAEIDGQKDGGDCIDAPILTDASLDWVLSRKLSWQPLRFQTSWTRGEQGLLGTSDLIVVWQMRVGASDASQKGHRDEVGVEFHKTSRCFTS